MTEHLRIFHELITRMHIWLAARRALEVRPTKVESVITRSPVRSWVAQLSSKWLFTVDYLQEQLNYQVARPSGVMVLPTLAEV